MRTLFAYLFFASLIPGYAGSKSEVLSNRYTYERSSEIKQDVDTQAGTVYGLNLGAGEEEVRTHFGLPIGVVYVNEGMKILIYGSKFAVTVQHNQFIKAAIGSPIFDYSTKIELKTNALYDTPQWEIDGKVRSSDSFESVIEKLGLRIQSPKHSLITASGQTLLDLQFTKNTSPYGDLVYKLRSFTVERTR